MEVLQKITIYDLLGYTVPGTILVGVIEMCFFYSQLFGGEHKNYMGYICGVTILLGYVVGMVIAELTNVFLEHKCVKKRFENKEELTNIGYTTILKALEKAGIMDQTSGLLSGNQEEQIKKYYRYMYADIQSDSKYSRIHNYASSELVCKNSSFVFLISTLLILVSQYGNLKIAESVAILIVGITGAALLFRRYLKQRDQKNAYTLDWFVQKHLGDECKLQIDTMETGSGLN